MTESDRARFDKFVDKQGDGCWLWTGATAKGYGVFGLNGRLQLAHRVSYAADVGPIPAGAQVLHDCDEPRRVRPDHLKAGSRSNNMRDRSARGRHRVVLTDDQRRIGSARGHATQRAIREQKTRAQSRAPVESEGRSMDDTRDESVGGIGEATTPVASPQGDGDTGAAVATSEGMPEPAAEQAAPAETLGDA